MFFVFVLIFVASAGVSAGLLTPGAFVFIGCGVVAVTAYVMSVSSKQAKLNLEIVKAIRELQASVPSEET